MNKQLLGVSQISYKYNKPIQARYVVGDESLNYSPEQSIQVFSSEDLKSYQNKISYVDTEIYNPRLKKRVRELYQQISLLIELRVLAGEDFHIYNEGPLSELQED